MAKPNAMYVMKYGKYIIEFQIKKLKVQIKFKCINTKNSFSFSGSIKYRRENQC